MVESQDRSCCGAAGRLTLAVYLLKHWPGLGERLDYHTSWQFCYRAGLDTSVTLIWDRLHSLPKQPSITLCDVETGGVSTSSFFFLSHTQHSK